MKEVMINSNLRKKILENIKKTEKELLWTWDERLESEVREVGALLED